MPLEGGGVVDSVSVETPKSISESLFLPKSDSTTPVEPKVFDSIPPKKRKTGPQHDERKFFRMTIRIVDSLSVTPGAIARLHPEDKVLFDRFFSSGKQLSPIWDYKTGKTLPFPYAFPARYGADIRRLDSIKAADSLRRKQ